MCKCGSVFKTASSDYFMKQFLSPSAVLSCCALGLPGVKYLNSGCYGYSTKLKHQTKTNPDIFPIFKNTGVSSMHELKV